MNLIIPEPDRPTCFPMQTFGRVAILHGRHDNLEVIAREINRDTDYRVWQNEAAIAYYRTGQTFEPGVEGKDNVA